MLCVGSVPPSFGRAVFFVTLKNAVSSAIVIVVSRCPRNSFAGELPPPITVMATHPPPRSASIFRL